MTTVKGALGTGVALLVAFAFVGVITTCIVSIGIWPGEAKLLAPVLCPDDRPDAFVVSDTTNPSPGETVIDFSLNCVGERGEVTDVGFSRPFLLLSAIHGALLLPLFALFGRGRKGRREELRAELRRRQELRARGRDDEPDDDRGEDVFVDSSTPGPFVN